MYPKNPELASEGSYRGHSYHHEAILLVAGPPAPSPFSNTCDFRHLPRIQVPGSELQYWLNYFEKHPEAVFRSDGRPQAISFPRALISKFNKSRFPRLEVHNY
jgi:hypothetical protein